MKLSALLSFHLFWVQRFAGLTIAVALIGCSTASRQTTGGTTEVGVFYATSRMITGSADPEKTFGNKSKDNQIVTFGQARVRMPTGHQPGNAGGTSIAGYEPDPRQGLLPGAFYTKMEAGLASQSAPMIVYVHGFNNSFAEAAHRAAHFSADLDLSPKPVPVIFSWPSAESLFAYARDEETVHLNQNNLRRFLAHLHTSTKPSKIILIGHSMGCRALTFGLRDYFFEEIMTQGWHVSQAFDELVLIEPDVTADYFKQNLIAAKALCHRITIYTSQHDLALKASKSLHQYESLGLSQITMGKGVDVIDASVARNNFLGHSYDGPLFFRDLRQVVQGAPATARTTLAAEADIFRLKK